MSVTRSMWWAYDELWRCYQAHILDSLPQYSHYVEEAVRQHRCDRRCLPRFSRQETEDILDTLRLPSTQHDMQHTVELYLSGQESLLTCVAHTLASPQRYSDICSRVFNLTLSVHCSGKWCRRERESIVQSIYKILFHFLITQWSPEVTILVDAPVDHILIIVFIRSYCSAVTFFHW